MSATGARVSRSLRAIRWRLGLLADLALGGARRHRAVASLRGLVRRHTWRRYVRQIHRRRPGTQVIAIAMVEHLGDIVASEPVARHVRAMNPDAHIVWVVRDAYRELLESNPNVNEVLTVGCLTEWIHLTGGRVFDRTIDLHVPGRFCPICNCHLINETAPEGIGMHNYYAHGSLLAIASKCGGLPPLDDAPRVYIPPPVAGAVDQRRLPERFIVVHCTSNQDVRDWSAPNWRDLALEMMQRHELPVVEVGLTPIVCSDDPRYVDLCGKLSILETAEVIRRAALFIGIDSGPAHLANAVGTPGVVLLGHYRAYRRYMPYSGEYASGANATILHADGPASSLSVERVLEAVDARLTNQLAAGASCGGRA